MSRAIASRIYDLYGRFYDRFELLFKHRISKALSALPFHPGDRALDIGVGTGLSLDHYPSFVHVTGIDLSVGMLQQAQRKLDIGAVRASAPRSQTLLLQADALNLPFPDKSFDFVFLSHVISTVPDPHRCLAESLRVAGDFAIVVLVNHFRSPYPVINWVESAIDPVCRKLGWRADLSLDELLSQTMLSNRPSLKNAEGFLFRILYLQKSRNALQVVSLPAPWQREASLDPA